MNDGSEKPNPSDIFNDALELEGAERAAFLDRACAGDQALRREIEEMLALADKNSALIEPPAPVPERLGKYRLLSQIGRGGMGVVYKAEDTQLGRTVALKILPRELARDAASRERFEREARLLASLNNERIATLHSLEQAGGIHFLTMEYVEGRTFAEMLDDGPLTVTDMLDYAGQIAAALEAAHVKGIVHRDLKPANIIVTPQGRVKVLDFGIAKALGVDGDPEREPGVLGGGLQTSAAMGTPAYMSPEQVRGGTVDHRADLWAFGCILYECLTGRRLLESGTAELVVDGAVDLSGLPPGTPRRVAGLLARCLAVDPARRLPSAGEARRVIDGAVAAERARGRRLKAAAVLLPFVVAGGLAVWFLRPGPKAVATAERVDQKSLRVLAIDGSTIWAREFEDEMLTNRLRGGGDKGYAPVTMVKEEGRNRAVVVASQSASAPSLLWCLDAKDGTPRWQLEARWVEPLSASGRLYYQWTHVVRWPGHEQPLIVTGLRDGIWYNFAVQFITLDGRRLGTYHHPGPVYFPSRPGHDQLEDGSLILWGSNSSARFIRRLVPWESPRHCGCVILLDPVAGDVQAFPYSENLSEVRDWPGLAPARERAYLLTTPIHPRLGAAVVNIDRAGGRADHSYQAQLSDGRIILLDSELRPLSCYMGIPSPADSIRALGQATFLPFLYMHDGQEELIDVPLKP